MIQRDSNSELTQLISAAS